MKSVELDLLQKCSMDEAKSVGEAFAEVEPEDLVKYGLIPSSSADFQ